MASVYLILSSICFIVVVVIGSYFGWMNSGFCTTFYWISTDFWLFHKNQNVSNWIHLHAFSTFRKSTLWLLLQLFIKSKTRGTHFHTIRNFTIENFVLYQVFASVLRCSKEQGILSREKKKNKIQFFFFSPIFISFLLCINDVYMRVPICKHTKYGFLAS